MSCAGVLWRLRWLALMTASTAPTSIPASCLPRTATSGTLLRSRAVTAYIVYRSAHGNFPVLDGLLDCHEPNNAALLACHLHTSGPPLLALWRTTHCHFEQQMDCSGTERWDVSCDKAAQIAYASEILRILVDRLDALLFGGGDLKEVTLRGGVSGFSGESRRRGEGGEGGRRRCDAPS